MGWTHLSLIMLKEREKPQVQTNLMADPAKMYREAELIIFYHHAMYYFGSFLQHPEYLSMEKCINQQGKKVRNVL